MTELLIQEDGLIKKGKFYTATIMVDTPAGTTRFLDVHVSKGAIEACGPKPLHTKSGLRICKLHPKFSTYKPLTVPEKIEARKQLMVGKPNAELVR